MPTTSYERFDQLLAQQEASVAQAFRDFVALVQSDQIMAAIIERLEAHDQEGAMRIVDSYVSRMGDIFPAVSAAVGLATAGELAEIVPDLVLAVSFDPTLPRAAELIRANRLRFIRDFTASQRQSVSQALERAYREGAGTQAAARAIRGSIGLTAYQEGVVTNYRSMLTNLDRDALDRALRDRRFDPTVERAIELDRPLTPAQIDNMTERYRQRMLAMRSETIATTEGGRATSEAREESLQQMVEQTGLDQTRVERIWNTTQDARRRDWHAAMQGQKRAMGELFVDGLGNRLRYPHDPAAPANTVIKCRCGLTFSILPAA